MKLQISIDKNRNISVYKQIALQIGEALENGILAPGDKLPTERELAQSLGLARGTISKAYGELERNCIIEVTQGSGSYIKKAKVFSDAERKNAAVLYINEFLKKVETLGFTPEEIKAMIDISISERENPQRRINIATIDCNEESLAIFKEQFAGFPNISVKMFLLDEVAKYSKPEKVLEDYGIIITTLTHYQQIIGIVPTLKDRVFKVAVSPTQETIVQIAATPGESKFGMIIRSSNFKNLMLLRLSTLSIDTKKVGIAFESDIAGIEKLLLEMDVLIIPHFLLMSSKSLISRLPYFRERGGRVIDFRYQIELGSLIHIEERINRLLSAADTG